MTEQPRLNFGPDPRDRSTWRPDDYIVEVVDGIVSVLHWPRGCPVLHGPAGCYQSCTDEYVARRLRNMPDCECYLCSWKTDEFTGAIAAFAHNACAKCRGRVNEFWRTAKNTTEPPPVDEYALDLGRRVAARLAREGQ